MCRHRHCCRLHSKKTDNHAAVINPAICHGMLHRQSGHLPAPPAFATLAAFFAAFSSACILALRDARFSTTAPPRCSCGGSELIWPWLACSRAATSTSASRIILLPAQPKRSSFLSSCHGDLLYKYRQISTKHPPARAGLSASQGWPASALPVHSAVRPMWTCTRMYI